MTIIKLIIPVKHVPLHMPHNHVPSLKVKSSVLLFFIDFADRHVEKENLADFISKKREMFLVQVC